jgi:hypothetical protein
MGPEMWPITKIFLDLCDLCLIVMFRQGHWGEAAKKLAELVNDDTFRSLEGKSKHQLWLELCDIVTKHPKEVAGLKVDAILRSGIRKFTDEVCQASRH